MAKVFFVGAGPGDPELITLKGKRLLEEADLIIYAGSLVNPELLHYNKQNAECFDSAGMTLEEVIWVIKKRSESVKTIVRLHTGDPVIFGAIQEQMFYLEQAGIEYEVIPGVSSFTAAASRIKREMTLPGISQTVICTRLEGRTPVPELESLEKLASHKSSMAIFLSVGMINRVVEKLLTAFSSDTPVAIVQRATWKDEKIVLGTLSTIEAQVQDHSIKKTAMILVGDFIKTSSFEFSKLYDKNFTHEYRKGR